MKKKNINLYQGSLEYLYNIFIKNIKQGEKAFKPHYIITPNRFINTITKYHIFKEIPPFTTLSLRVITFGHFINELYLKYSNENKLYIDSPYLLSLLFSIYLREKNKSLKFSEKAIQSLIEAIMEKEENIPFLENISDLMDISAFSSQEDYEIENFKKILENATEYNHFLEESQLLDRKDIYKFVYNYLKKEKPPLHHWVNEFSFWGFVYLTPIEQQIINELLQLTKEQSQLKINFYIVSEKVENTSIEDIYKKITVDYFQTNTNFAGNLAKLYKEDKPLSLFTLPKNVEILSTQDTYDEIWCCAKIIRKLLDEKTNPVDICVVIPLEQKYTNLVDFIFRQNFIPTNNFLKVRLSDYPLTRFILKIYKVVKDKTLQLSDIIALISHPYCAYYKKSETLRELEKLSTENSLISLYYLGDWVKFLNNKNSSYPLCYKLISELNNIANLEKNSDIAPAIIKRLITKKLAKNEKLLLAKIEETINFYDMCIEKITKNRISKEEHFEGLKKYLQTQFYPLSTEYKNGVNIISYDLLSFTKFRYLFFVGLDYNTFESGYTENPFFSDRIKNILLNTAIGLRTKSLSTNLRLYTILTLIKHAQKTHLIYKRIELPDKNLSPSKLIYILDEDKVKHIPKVPSFFSKKDANISFLVGEKYELLTPLELEIVKPTKTKNVFAIEKNNSQDFSMRFLSHNDKKFNVTTFSELIVCQKKFFYKSLDINFHTDNLEFSLFPKNYELGNLIHKVIENFFNNKYFLQKNTEEVLKEIINKTLQTDEDQIFSFTREILKEYYIEYLYQILKGPLGELLNKIINNNSSKIVDIQTEKFVEGKVENILLTNAVFNLKGKIDLEVKKENEHLLIDFKSKNVRSFETTPKDILQLLLYSYLIQEKESHDIKLAILAIPAILDLETSSNREKGKLLQEITVQEKEEVEGKLKEILNHTIKNNYFKLNINEYHQCRYCEFRFSCGKYFKELENNI
jgi:ATP-dependent helicase/DNAse subunit B